MEAKVFVNEMTEENLILKDKLKKYEQQNTGIGNDIDQKENTSRSRTRWKAILN
jgi:hypothetical protein